MPAGRADLQVRLSAEIPLMAFALDTHAAVRNLTAAGFAPEQAEAIVATVTRSDSELATRADLAAIKAELHAAIAAGERRVILANLAIAGLLFAALRVFG